MTIAYWCVLAAGLMPFLWTSVAKTTGERFNNRTPREWQARLSGLPARAHAAHLNSFEAFPLFAAAVIIADLLDAPQATVDLLALAFIGLRVLYGILYLADQHALRSLVWFAALACTVAIFVVAA
ncbi:MAG TPA: MAPEG family protein [Xanthomonadales bacterium]|nr:MAPEG family protein [Xanthomonadales bacterium]